MGREVRRIEEANFLLGNGVPACLPVPRPRALSPLSSLCVASLCFPPSVGLRLDRHPLARQTCFADSFLSPEEAEARGAYEEPFYSPDELLGIPNPCLTHSAYDAKEVRAHTHACTCTHRACVHAHTACTCMHGQSSKFQSAPAAGCWAA